MLKGLIIKTNLYEKSYVHYFDDIINVNDFDLNNILFDEKSYKYFLFYEVAYNTSYGAKPLYITFDKIYGYIKKYDKTKYLGLFYSDERNIIMLKSNILDVYFHKYMKININSDDDLTSEKSLNIHNLVIFIKSAFLKITVIIILNCF